MTDSTNPSRPPCPYCGHLHVVKNGSTHHKKQKYRCKQCRKQFVENRTKKLIDSQVRETVKKLLLERISLAGIARSLNISRTWLQNFVNDFYRQISYQVRVFSEIPNDLVLESDELWSYVVSSINTVWIWLVLNRKTREIIGIAFGNRSRQKAQELWDSLPEKCQKLAQCYTDFLPSYETVIPSQQHHPSDKSSGETSHIERFNNTLRQRLARLTRKTLSFSKSDANHEGAILYFINHYNASLITA